MTKYGHSDSSTDSINEKLIEETKHWPSNYFTVLSLYQSVLDKYNNGIFQKNILDDLRLSLELLKKKSNEKLLENQLSVLREYIQNKNISIKLGNMFQMLVEYYSRYNNTYVKYNDDLLSRRDMFKNKLPLDNKLLIMRTMCYD